VNKNMKLN